MSFIFLQENHAQSKSVIHLHVWMPIFRNLNDPHNYIMCLFSTCFSPGVQQPGGAAVCPSPAATDAAAAAAAALPGAAAGEGSRSSTPSSKGNK